MAEEQKHRHGGHRERQKTKFLADRAESWPDHEVLEFLLYYSIPQGDVNDLAHTLMEQFGSLAGVFDASLDELKKVKGVGNHTGMLLRFIPVLFKRYQRDKQEKGTIIHSAEDAYRYMEEKFYGAQNEMVYVLCLDGKRQVLGVRKVAEGSIQMAEVNARRIAEEALGLRASRIYVAHNHVSNIAIPSPDDWMVTDVLRTVLAPIGIELVDHLIFSHGDMVSLAQSEQLRNLTFV